MVEASAGVQQLREVILNLAVPGKLVLPNPSDEPAIELKECIKNHFQTLMDNIEAQSTAIHCLKDFRKAS